MFARASGIAAVDVDPDPVLIDYCLQRLDVPDPSLYVAVSRDLPHTQALARRLRSVDQAVAWGCATISPMAPSFPMRATASCRRTR